MTRARIIKVPALRADQRPAHEHFVARVTASMIREHGSYEAARIALNNELRAVRFAPRPGGAEIGENYDPDHRTGLLSAHHP